MQKNIILLNPSSGQNRALKYRDYLEKVLNKYNITYEIILTQSEQHLRELVRHYIDGTKIKNVKSILTAGGDSTFTILINELIRAKKNIPVGIIPMGSSDDIARELGILSIDDAAVALSRNHFQKMDVVKLSDEDEYTHYFPGQCNMGIGVFVNRFVGNYQKRSYLFRKNQTIAGILGMYHAFKEKAIPQEFTITYKNSTGDKTGVVIIDQFVSLLFSKIRFWATGRLFLPEAKINDGKINLLIIKKCSFWKVLKIMFQAGSGQHVDHKTVETFASTKYRITSIRLFPIQADGDIIMENGVEKLFEGVTIEAIKNKIEILSNHDHP